MLFHVTVDHTAESCPLVTNSPEKMITSAGQKKLGKANSYIKAEIT